MFMSPMNNFYNKLQSYSKYTTPPALVMTVICVWLTLGYEGGLGLHIIAFGIIAAWLFVPFLCWFFFMPKENPVSCLVSIYPAFLKKYTITGVIVILSFMTIFIFGAYINVL